VLPHEPVTIPPLAAELSTGSSTAYLLLYQRKHSSPIPHLEVQAQSSEGSLYEDDSDVIDDLQIEDKMLS
jgi:hypothetical protein